jgi:hypothetical protein
MENRDQLEAQFWWAFSCLALTGRRQAEELYAELLRRRAGSYPTTEEVNSIVDEACCYLSVILNSTLINKGPDQSSLSGWERHLLALAKRPD